MAEAPKSTNAARGSPRSLPIVFMLRFPFISYLRDAIAARSTAPALASHST